MRYITLKWLQFDEISNFPCPICLVPVNEQVNLSKKYPERRVEKMEEIYRAAQKIPSGPKDDLL